MVLDNQKREQCVLRTKGVDMYNDNFLQFIDEEVQTHEMFIESEMTEEQKQLHETRAHGWCEHCPSANEGICALSVTECIELCNS